MVEQSSLFADNPEYNAFVDKFKPKKTTDDCYTPPIVYDAVAEWVANEYGLDRRNFVRPFYPGGDYQAFDYAPDAVVVDNPPFSIISQIKRFYSERGIKFFVFHPGLTLFGGYSYGVTLIPTNVTITYENGANVATSFATNIDKWQVRTAPTLYNAVKAANDKNIKSMRRELPKYEYPDEVITAAMVARWCKYGVDFKVKQSECYKIGALEAQKAVGKKIFGDGFLIAERKAAEREEAEREEAHEWGLSERERKIVKRLSQTEERSCNYHTP